MRTAIIARYYFGLAAYIFGLSFGITLAVYVSTFLPTAIATLFMFCNIVGACYGIGRLIAYEDRNRSIRTAKRTMR